jgi:hypothetical protein
LEIFQQLILVTVALKDHLKEWISHRKSSGAKLVEDGVEPVLVQRYLLENKFYAGVTHKGTGAVVRVARDYRHQSLQQ